jgi:hypothetical protein
VAFLVTDDEDPDDIRQDQDFLGGALDRIWDTFSWIYNRL